MDNIVNSDFRIVWEALTTCPGNCSGCNIVKQTNIETGLWDDHKFKTAVKHTKLLLSEKKYNYQKIFLGAGDYLYLPEDKMAKVLDYVNDAMDKDCESRIVLFTTSAIGKPEFLKSQIDILQRLLLERNLDCFPEVVFDFAKIRHRKYWGTYIDNMQILSTAFPVCAINIQVGENTFSHGMNQKKLQEFIKYCGITRLEVVATPHSGNYKIIDAVWNDMVHFLNETVSVLNDGDKSFVHPQVNTVFNNLKNSLGHENTSVLEEFDSLKNSYLKNSIYISHNGDFSVFYSGLSNIIPLSYAVNNKINIFNSMFTSINVENIIKSGTIFNHKINAVNKCGSCKFKLSCNSMGNMITIHNLKRKDSESCPLGIYDYLNYLKNFKNAKEFHCERLKTVNTNYKEDLKSIQSFNPSKVVD